MPPAPNAQNDSSILIRTKATVLAFAEALFLAGNQHKYQKRLVFLLSLQRVSLGFLFTAFPFLFKQPKFECKLANDTNFFPCEPTPHNCQYDVRPIAGSDNSLISYFGLYCDHAEYANLAKNLFTAACSIGILIIFPLADKIGRKPGLIGSYILGAASLVLMTTTKTWWAFTFLLTLAGFGVSPYITNSLLILNESSGAKMRANASVIINSFWTLGQILVGVLAYLLSNDWQKLLLFGTAIPLALCLPLLLLWTHESPMFLASKKRFLEAKNILAKIACTNNKELNEFEFIEEKSSDRKKKTETYAKKSYGFMDLFRFKSLRMTTLLGSFLCFTIYFNYYGTIFALTSVQVNSYLLTIVLALSELVAYFVSGVMAQKLSRRLSFAICSALCCVANLLFMLFPVPEHCAQANEVCIQVYMQLILSAINRFSVAIAMALSGIYVNEIFPTSVRAIGSGLIVFVARLGSFIATIAISLSLRVGINPILVFGAVCLPAILISIMTKETQGLPLPESIEEEKPDYIKVPTDMDRSDSAILNKAIRRQVSLEHYESKIVMKKSFSETTATSAHYMSKGDVALEYEE